jgi:hypothetical protein
MFDALSRAGNFFTPGRNGVTSELANLLHQQGLHHVQTRAHTLDYRAGTQETDSFSLDMRLGFRTTVPFLKKWIKVPEDYEEIYQQMLQEMQQPDFVVRWHLLTAWGTKPRGA